MQPPRNTNFALLELSRSYSQGRDASSRTPPPGYSPSRS